MGSNKILGQQIILVKEFLGPQKFGPNKFLALKIYFQKDLGFRVKKKFGYKNFWFGGKKEFCQKINLPCTSELEFIYMFSGPDFWTWLDHPSWLYRRGCARCPLPRGLWPLLPQPPDLHSFLFIRTSKNQLNLKCS